MWHSGADQQEEQDAGRTILVVEDEFAIRELITFLLEDAGYAVVDVPNGRVALERLEHIQPSLILLDINMPIMDGPTFVQVYQEAPGPHAPIVLVSALGANQSRVDELGVAGFLAKPFEIERLLDVVNTYARVAMHRTRDGGAIGEEDALSHRLLILIEQLDELRNRMERQREHVFVLLNKAHALEGRGHTLGIHFDEATLPFDQEAVLEP